MQGPKGELQRTFHPLVKIEQVRMGHNSRLRRAPCAVHAACISAGDAL